LVRRPEVTSPDTDWNIVSGQWLSYDATDFSHLGSHTGDDCGNLPIAVVGFTTDTQIVEEINATIVTVTIHTENVQTPFQLIVDASGTASSNLDYSAGFPISFTVPEGTNDLSFSIVILGDAITEGDETIILDITANANVYFTVPTQTITITENVAIVEQAQEVLTLYPNPASTSVSIQSEHGIDRVECMDMSGRIIEIQQFKGYPKQLNWSLDSTVPGSYFFIIHTTAGISRIPLLVIK
jgi:hypothetical protein